MHLPSSLLSPLRRGCSLFAMAATVLANVARAEKTEFNRDIRPILSDSCFACHGIDAKHREAKLRLDTADGALAEAESGAIPIVPGDMAKSEVWLRIISDDKNEIMPPPKAHKTLTAAQKETIKRWIEQGAPYQKQWAFETPVKADAPKVAGAIRNPSWYA